MDLKNPKSIIDLVEGSMYCGDLFLDRDENKIREQYREYAKIIHPDICTEDGAVDAFQKLYGLYTRALENLKNGTWEQNEMLWVPGQKGIKYLNKKPFELGTRYVTDDEVIYIFDSGKEKYLKQFLDSIQKLKNAVPNLVAGFKMRFPRVNHSTSNALYLAKKSKEYPLDSAIAAYKNTMDGRTIAWMISRMCDLLCYLDHVELVHNGLKMDNIFVNFEDHTISIYGGFWYAVPKRTRMIGAPKEIFDLMPSSVKTSKMSDPITDAESVKAMFRDIIKGNSTVPEPVKRWLNSGSTSEPVTEFKKWDYELEAAYGERKFFSFSVNPDEIYKKDN